MELIKRQKWENLFKSRELVHIDSVKELYARMTVIYLKKKDVVKSSVKGVAIEFDYDKLTSILGVPGKNGICEYIKDVWEESKEDGIWWIGTGENRRRDDDNEALEAEAEEEEKDQTEFDWEAVIDEAAEQGESRSDDQFYDAQVDVEEPVTETPDALAVPASPEQVPIQQKETTPSGVDPSYPSGHIPEAVMNKMQVEFERARANRFQADLGKAQAENARLLALLQQAQAKPKP
ncbi:hypothetical protein Dimus_033916 [Dionaea muscipula]